MGKTADESLDELAQRMTAFRERAAAARRLAEAISDERATIGLIEHAEEFEKKPEAIATEIVTLAQRHQDCAQNEDDLHAAVRTEPEDR